MNIIRQQREIIIKENNTAQQRLKDILEKINKRTNILDIREPLYGDIDFSILKEDFSNIKTIQLPEGEITNIINIPEGVTKLEIDKNFIFELNDLPSSLTSLGVTYNYLSNIDLRQLKDLEYLNVSHNQITELENLPTTIIELNCENNQLRSIDFRGLTNLKVLNVSYNKLTIIENLPENITDFNYDNNPSIEFRNSSVIPTGKTNKQQVEENSIQQQIGYEDSLQYYFKLKHKYEQTLLEEKQNIYYSSPTKKIARQKILKLKPQCINCKRAVGTIFSKKDNRYMAICGDTATPCRLKIEIFSGNYGSNIHLLYNFKESVDDLKDEIIRQKLDNLFNYISEERSINKFKQKLEEYNFDSIMFKELLDRHNENYNNPHKKELIQKKSDAIYKYIENIRELLKEYEKTENKEILKSAVYIQTKDLLPEINNLRLLSNEVMEINYDVVIAGGFGATPLLNYYLFKNDVALSKNDFTFGEPPRVLHFSMKQES
jgi:hypothetical protein